MNKRGFNLGLESSYLGCLGLLIPVVVIDISVITFVLKLFNLTTISLEKSVAVFFIGVLVLSAIIYYQFSD